MTTVFVGRARELELLEADLAASIGGHGRAVLVVGEPGIGKTRLADRIAEVARDRGVAVHWGRCWQGGGAPAFWPWTQLLRSCAADALPERDAAQVEWAAALVDALLGAGDAAAGDARSGVPSEQDRFRLFDAITSILQAHARVRPLLLVLDDLHDADESSLLLLQFLARGLLRSNIFVVATCREAEVRRSPLRTAAFTALSRESRRLTLKGLEAGEVEEFIDTVSRAPLDRGTREAVFRTTEGNPFFVDEVLRVLLAKPDGERRRRVEIPFTVKEAIRQRLRPAAATTSLLEVAAALGRDFDLRLLSRVAAKPASHCRGVLEEAAREGLVERMDDGACDWRFAHVLIRETLREDTPASQSRETHLRVASLLAGDRREGLPVHVASIAHHLYEALPLADRDEVLRALVDAGRDEMSSFAYEEAARDFARALDVLEADGEEDASPSAAEAMAEVLIDLGYAERCCGHLGQARETFRRAAVLLRPALGSRDGAPAAAELFARAVLGFGRFSETGRVDRELVALLREAIDALGDGDSPLHASVLARLAMALYFEPSPDACLALGTRAVEMAERCGDMRSHIHALVSRHFVLWRPGNADERLRVADSLVALCERSGDTESGLEARIWRIADRLELGQAARAEMESRRYEADAEASRLPVHRWQAAMLRSAFAWLAGRLSDAEREADSALAIGLAAELPNARVFHLAQMFQIRAADSRQAELEPSLRGVADAVPSMPIWSVCAIDAALAGGRVEDARREYERFAAGGFSSIPRDGMWLASLAVLSRIAAALGDAAGASRLLELLSPYEDAWVVAVTAITVPGPVRLFLGILAAATGDPDTARRHFDAVAEESRTLGYRTLTDVCEAELARLGDPRFVPGPQPGGGPVPEGSALFRQGSEFWTLAVGEREVRLRDSKGLRYIHFLLGHPDREFHVFELVSAVEGTPAGETLPWSEDHPVGRRTGSPSEQVRVRVTKVISLALKRIQQADPLLGRALARDIRTGTFCAYRPDPDHALRWITDADADPAIADSGTEARSA